MSPKETSETESVLPERTWNYLKEHSEISELILTGGDPLSLKDRELEALFEKISTLSAVRVVRIHSRMLATLPARLTSDLMSILHRPRNFSLSWVHHFNHPAELTIEACRAIRQIAKIGIPQWNQSVLLRGVNDSAAVLRELFQSLYFSGVSPMYLHFPDWTAGTFGFRGSLVTAVKQMREAIHHLSGPAIPRFVWDDARALGKMDLLDTESAEVIAEGEVVDPKGLRFGFERLRWKRYGQEALNIFMA